MKQVNELKTMIANELYDKTYDELDETTSNDVETLAYRLVEKQTNNIDESLGQFEKALGFYEEQNYNFMDGLSKVRDVKRDLDDMNQVVDRFKANGDNVNIEMNEMIYQIDYRINELDSIDARMSKYVETLKNLMFEMDYKINKMEDALY